MEAVEKPDGLVHVLAGLGGSGKSTIALAVARDVRRIGLSTWWIPVSDAASVTSALMGLARKLGAPDGEVAEALAGRANPADVLWSCLEDAPGWMLVFDNADDLDVLTVGGRLAGEGAGWLRPTTAGLVLVTSRLTDSQAWGSARVHRIDPLGESDGGQALRDLSPGSGGDDEAAALSRRLGGLPLALHQAGAYLASPFATQRTFEAYGRALEERFAQLLGRGDEERVRVTGTWELSLAALAVQGRPQSRGLLRVLSCFAAATPVPPNLVDASALADFAGGLTEAEEGLAGLLATGLIEARSSGGRPSIVVHPLVAEMTRRQAGGDQDVALTEAVRLLGVATGRLEIEAQTERPAWRALLPHLQFLLILYPAAAGVLPAGLAESAARASAALSWTGSFPAALQVADAALARMADEDPDSEGVLAVKFRRAIACRYLGRLDVAVSAFEEVLAARTRALGPDHPDTLTAWHYWASTIADQGHFASSESALRQVLMKKLEVLGPEHASTLATRHSIAAVLGRRGMPGRAEAESRLVLAARRRILGNEHPSTLATFHDVARYMREEGRIAEAEAAFREVLEARSRVLEPDHPRTLDTCHEIALILARQGDIAAARAMLDQVRLARTRVLGPGHPDTLLTVVELDRLQHTSDQSGCERS